MCSCLWRWRTSEGNDVFSAQQKSECADALTAVTAAAPSVEKPYLWEELEQRSIPACGGEEMSPRSVPLRALLLFPQDQG